MEFIRVNETHMEELKRLQIGYKEEIGEDAPAPEDFARLRQAIQEETILFFACAEGDRLIACCSVSPTFSTFDYRRSGVFEDFYILPEYRHQGIARQLVRYAIGQSGVSTLTVGCADCDVGMYQALGFRIPIGNLLAYDG